MLQRLFKIMLTRMNKGYEPCANLPGGYMVSVMYKRTIDLIRGYVRSGKAIFVGRGVTGVLYGVDFGRHVTLDDYVHINPYLRDGLHIGEGAKIGAYSRVVGTAHASFTGLYFTMGKRAACGEFCYFGCAGGIRIGDDVIMGQYVSLHAQEHLFDDVDTPIAQQGTTQKGIVIGDGCWIGAKATILDGTVIGKHCVIAAGAVVKGEFPDYTVIAGIPAKAVRHLKEAHVG